MFFTFMDIKIVFPVKHKYRFLTLIDKYNYIDISSSNQINTLVTLMTLNNI